MAESNSLSLPPLLSRKQDVGFWLNYLLKNNKQDPSDFEALYSEELPSDDKQITYAVWAKKGASVEESHDSEDEYLFMLRGSCTVIRDGIHQLYNAGELVYIPKNVVHTAISFSDDMLLIGQRVAA